jgi:superfamily II DNA or RNA helicase
MSIINFYELDEVKLLTPQYHNPNYDEETMPLKHPERAILLAPSGGGKTNLLLGIIKAMNGTFKVIILFTQNKNEPLYEYLEKKNTISAISSL